MSNIDSVLSKATNPDGSQRFYAPGQHPATKRLREVLARAEALDDGSETAAAYIDHLRFQLAGFERGEEMEKQDYLRAKGLS